MSASRGSESNSPTRQSEPVVNGSPADTEMDDRAKSEVHDDGKSEAADAASTEMEVDTASAPSQTVPVPSDVVSATEAAPSSAEVVPSGTNDAMSVAPIVASTTATEVLGSPGASLDSQSEAPVVEPATIPPTTPTQANHAIAAGSSVPLLEMTASPVPPIVEDGEETEDP